MTEKQQNMKEELIKRDIVVNDDGSVILTDHLKYTVNMNARDFLTFTRNQTDAISKINDQLTEERRKFLLKEKTKIEKQIEDIKPYIEDSEKKALEHNKKIELENKTKAIEHILSKKHADRNLNFLNGVLQNLKDGEYLKIINGLSKESYKIELQSFMQQLRKKRAMKK
ncbi:MAG: hypothetical protein KAK00_00420 [Nanoarchaeota archaeon]|nr:hypothetical protein [Nanoarchaeota archaeon]